MHTTHIETEAKLLLSNVFYLMALYPVLYGTWQQPTNSEIGYNQSYFLTLCLK